MTCISPWLAWRCDTTKKAFGDIIDLLICVLLLHNIMLSCHILSVQSLFVLLVCVISWKSNHIQIFVTETVSEGVSKLILVIGSHYLVDFLTQRRNNIAEIMLGCSMMTEEQSHKNILGFTVFAGLNGLLYLSEGLETGCLSIQSSPLALSKQVNAQTLQLWILAFAQAC